MSGPTNLPPGYRRLSYPNVGSTSLIALESARRGDRGRLWITAERQTKGRGRRGRSWDSPPGNLYASLYLADPGPAETAATLAFAAGVALHKALADCAGAGAARQLSLKWPNDLLAGGRKVAGILLDGEELGGGRFGVVVGFGVNCAAHPDGGTNYPATSLAAIGVDVAPESLFHCLAHRVAEEIAAWNDGRGFASIRRSWIERAYGLGDLIRVQINDRIIEGRFDDLDLAGRLIVTATDGTTKAISAGDVFFAAPD